MNELINAFEYAEWNITEMDGTRRSAEDIFFYYLAL